MAIDGNKWSHDKFYESVEAQNSSELYRLSEDLRYLDFSLFERNLVELPTKSLLPEAYEDFPVLIERLAENRKKLCFKRTSLKT